MAKSKTPKPEKDMLSPGGYRALASFRYAMRRYVAFTEENAKSEGLTSQQHQALLAIKAHTLSKPMSIGDLAAELLIKHHSAVELVGRLEKARLTKRTPDAGDGRKVLVSLTATGDRILTALSARNLQELRSIGPALPDLLNQLLAGAAPDKTG